MVPQSKIARALPMDAELQYKGTRHIAEPVQASTSYMELSVRVAHPYAIRSVSHFRTIFHSNTLAAKERGGFGMMNVTSDGVRSMETVTKSSKYTEKRSCVRPLREERIAEDKITTAWSAMRGAASVALSIAPRRELSRMTLHLYARLFLSTRHQLFFQLSVYTKSWTRPIDAMPPPNRRSTTVACRRCNRKKVKCAGGDSWRNLPCSHCRSTGSECTYPTRERHVTVSESYLHALQATVAHANAQSTHKTAPTRPEALQLIAQPLENLSRSRFVENATADAFVSRLRKLGTDRSDLSITERDGDEQASIKPTAHTEAPAYDYFHLVSDRNTSNVTLKLPPYPYAISLVDQFEAYMGFEYHWYLRKTFRERLDSTYADSSSESSKDRTWLCRLLVVLALGETYNSRMAPWIDLRENPGSHTVGPYADPPPPGVGFFEQAMSLFKTPCEDVTVDHVEALNLIAFYSYSLDRRRSAYIYAGLSMRIASSLMLNAPSTRQTETPLELEHHRRLWWTTYLLDAMTGSEMGINSAWDHEEIERRLGLPSDAGLSPQDRQELSPALIFTAYIPLCSIRSEVLSLASSELANASYQQIEETLRRPIAVLERWRESLPSTINFSFTSGIPPGMLSMQECRGLASLYIRYHHVSTWLHRLFVRSLALR
jgi:proline utilization trans-activator